MNTPDTEEKTFKQVFLERYVQCEDWHNAGVSIDGIVDEARSSRDTYWKERVDNLVREWVTHNAKTIQHNNGATEYIEVRELLTLLDNLK